MMVWWEWVLFALAIALTIFGVALLAGSLAAMGVIQ